MKPPVFHRMFGYNVDLLPNRHLAELERGVLTTEEALKRSGLTIGFPGWGLLYHLLLSHLDRSREEIIIETGTNWGCTTIVLAQALIDAGCRGKVISVELSEENLARAQENVASAGVADRVVLCHGNSHDVLPDLVAGLEGCRFAFLDASHRYEDVLFEFRCVLPKLASDALVVFDNTYCIGEPGEEQWVNGALKTIVEEHQGSLINLEFVSWFTPGLAIWQKRPKL